jgi:predicted RNase H-like nuclease
MLTLGVDLAAQDRNTAICLVRWNANGARVLEARRDVSDDCILDLAEKAARGGRDHAVGVDAPFGWPRAFERAVAAWAGGGAWPEPRETDAVARRERARTLRLRFTDRWIAERLRRDPLSVSTDKIAICAMRAAALLSAAAERDGGAPLDRVAGPWFEVYPAAARRQWKLPTVNDKADRTLREARLAAIEALVGAAGTSLVFSGQTRERCVESDDVLDALLCAFVARAARLARTHRPPADPDGTIAREGWIQLPTGGLEDLFG